MISGRSRFRLHRPIDVVVSVVGLICASPVLAVSWFAAGRAAHGSGLFRQLRVGQGAKLFEIIKFRTMNANSSGPSVTTESDTRITSVGRLLRRTKVDEIPQLVNVLRGEMSLIGPRPDVPGFADQLTGDDRVILDVRPGVTGPASVLFADEESLLATVDDPRAFNSDVVYPLKTAINRAWIEHGTLLDDLRILVATVIAPAPGGIEKLILGWNPDLVLDPRNSLKSSERP